MTKTPKEVLIAEYLRLEEIIDAYEVFDRVLEKDCPICQAVKKAEEGNIKCNRRANLGSNLRCWRGVVGRCSRFVKINSQMSDRLWTFYQDMLEIREKVKNQYRYHYQEEIGDAIAKREKK